MRSRPDPKSVARALRGTPRLIAVCLAASALLLAACGGAAAPSAEQLTASAAKATIAAAPTTAPTVSAAPSGPKINPAAPVVSIVASANGESLLLKMDQIAVAAGDITISFKNADTKMDHELWIYPVQDITKLMAAKRAGQSPDEVEFFKDLAGTTDSVAPGASIQIPVTLKAGLYEIACFETIKSADGKSAVVHIDKGQFATLAATGAGGPAASIATASNNLTVEMKDGPYGSWIFMPDRLVATAGNVTFKVTNNMKIAHDFVVYPIGDVSGPIAEGLKSGENIDLAAPAVPVAEDLDAGKTETNTIPLTPGTYVMACYMVSKNADGTTFIHRDMGQRIVFVVK
jgi:uncharacterized cupredoxin-like copper-binding protein